MGAEDCWTWGIHQFLARGCGKPITNFVQCCQKAGEDPKDRFPPLPALQASEGKDQPCNQELMMAQRCIVHQFWEKPGETKCRKSFEAFVEGDDADGKSEQRLTKAWRCAFEGRNYERPLLQLIRQADAVGACRSAGAVENTAGKGAWTSGA
eukprot:CAMPEP_0206437356 /NCGR_PEP_ID=MMETSP0324_2-20121206/10994_1 /ASSEMBLY_ACC=CAM_ASM_000836 /TAXON_ID=2866 /ORGANISM="Crypthecodinium cohnii, Strain Seligo" /LENGTH=151 /DNA_ID=CAMNT_0053904625 /DNA_START=17 /DNA_END=472 /DNA_ORIENTATION=+